MRKLSTLFMVIASGISACTFQVEVQTPQSATSEISTPTKIALFPSATITPAPESLSATPTSSLPAPQFLNARFTLDPNTANFQSIFPAETRRIFVVWDYRNMREGMMVRRDWYYRNVLWITREEPWDFSKYGTEGTIRDVSVYDLDAGLRSGDYRFELYIDSQPQPIGGGIVWPSFTVSQNASIIQVISPNGLWVALVDDPKKLLIVDPDRRTHEMFSGKEVANLAWLPDNSHLIFIDRDRSEQVGTSSLGVRDDLWIININTGRSSLLYRADTGLFGQFVISLNGRYIAGTEGSGYADACLVDSKVVVFELDGNFQTAKRFGQNDFTGFPRAVDEGSIYPTAPAEWQGNTQIKVPLEFACTTDSSLKGFYIFDLSSLKVEKR